jgi:hypothetical protein
MKSIFFLFISLVFSLMSYSQGTWNPISRSLPDGSKGSIEINNVKISTFCSSDARSLSGERICFYMLSESSNEYYGSVKFSNTSFMISIFDTNHNLISLYKPLNVKFKLKKEDEISQEYEFDNGYFKGTIYILLNPYGQSYMLFSLSRKSSISKTKTDLNCIMKYEF